MTENLFAITASQNYINQALEEAREVDKELKILQNYGNGILLAATKMEKLQFNDAMLKKKPVFIRHISSFDMDVEIQTKGVAEIAKEVEKLPLKELSGKKVAVQIRKARGEYAFNPVDIKGEIDLLLTAQGAEAEIKEPQEIISLLLDENHCYIGLSAAKSNLSSWSGGMLHYRKEDADISRAKFKLMEAIEVFQLDLSGIRKALDLGAAPGGWTSVLLEKGVGVTAVDTGDMDPRLNKFKNYTYIKGNASELDLPKNSFDMLTSDISWNPKNTAQLVNHGADFLRDGGLAVVTVKLMGTKVRRIIKEVKEIYQEVFDITEAKQLFHNRDEITLVMRKRKS